MNKVLTLILILIFAGIGFYLFQFFNLKDINPGAGNNDLSLINELPQAVQNKRKAIIEATEKKDYKKLSDLAGNNFSYSFGGDYEGGFETWIKYLEKNENPFQNIRTILEQPFAKQGNIYVWPGYFLKNSDQWSEEDLKQMRKIEDEEAIENWRKFGGYIGYRIGIRDDGTWLFYIAGD